MASSTQIVDSATSVNYDSTDTAWSNPTNVAVEDATAATAAVGDSGFTAILRAVFSAGTFAIPADARVDGVEVQYRASTNGAAENEFDEDVVQLHVGGSMTGLNLRNTAKTGPGVTETTFTAGGSAENWGLTMTPNMANQANFGVSLRFARNDAASITLSIFWIKLIVHYTTSVGTAYRAEADAGICVGTIPLDANAITTKFRFRFPGLGTPKIALFFTPVGSLDSYTNASTTTYQGPDARFYASISDGSNMYTAVSNAADGSFAVERGLLTNRLASGTFGTATISAFGEDYVEINYAAADFRRFMVCVAFAGSSLSAKFVAQTSMDGSTNETVDVTSIGFRPDVTGLISGLEESGAIHPAYGGANFGFADTNRNVSTLAEQQLKQVVAGTPSFLDDAKNMVLVTNNTVHEHVNFGESQVEEYHWTVDDFDASGFTINSSGDNAADTPDDGGGFFALAFNNDAQHAIGTFTTPTTTGSQSPTFNPSISFTPTFMMMSHTLGTSLNTREDDTSNGDLIGLTFMRDNICVSVGYTIQNGTNPINATYYLTRAKQYVLAGDETAILEAGLPTFTSGGYTATFNTANATARYGIFLALGDPSASTGGPGLLNSPFRF